VSYKYSLLNSLQSLAQRDSTFQRGRAGSLKTQLCLSGQEIGRYPEDRGDRMDRLKTQRSRSTYNYRKKLLRMHDMTSHLYKEDKMLSLLPWCVCHQGMSVE
jgi:hypothetical protein